MRIILTNDSIRFDFEIVYCNSCQDALLHLLVIILTFSVAIVLGTFTRRLHQQIIFIPLFIAVIKIYFFCQSHSNTSEKKVFGGITIKEFLTLLEGLYLHIPSKR